jgi:hypothetical protein
VPVEVRCDEVTAARAILYNTNVVKTPFTAMIHAVLIFNTHGEYALRCLPISLSIGLLFGRSTDASGKPRLSKFYTPLPPVVQQSLIAQIFSYISDRPAGLCNFLDAPDLVFPSPSTTSGKGESGKGKEVGKVAKEEDDVRVIYRHYATLYFVYAN